MISRQYAAGFFDGEGCVNITVRGKRRQVCLRVMIVNTDPLILQRIQLEFGGRLSSPKVHREGWKAFRSLTLAGNEGFNFLLAIAPYSIVKKQQVWLAIDFWNFQHKPRRERCELKKRGSRVMLVRTPETLTRELEFKNKMHELDRKGLTQ